MTGRERPKRADFQGSAPDSGKVPGVLGMQNVLNGVSMAVGVMEMALYSSYTRYIHRALGCQPGNARASPERNSLKL
jgi:hypothetical protein